MTVVAPLPATHILKARIDDPTRTPEERAEDRGLLALVEAACNVATRWGYDDNAALRWGIFKRAATASPDELGKERIDLGLALDELCRAAGVPLEGSIENRATC